MANSLTNPFDSVVTRTNRSGSFTLRPAVGRYKVSFQPPPTLLDQWATGKESEWAADVITVEADKEVVLEEKALPTGRVEGRLLDAAGRPVAFAGVAIENPSLDRFFQATTDADGRWFQTVRPGTYAVRFDTSNQAQWAHGKATPEAADPITVLADKTTIVDDKLAQTGSLSVRGMDARSGAPVTSFCVDAHTDFKIVFACTDNGVAELTELGAGTYTVKVTDGEHLDTSTPGVLVTAGNAATVTARMHQGATIAVTVTDAATGEPVGGICLSGKPADRATEYGGFVGDCADFSGKLTLTRVVPDRYVFFASAFDGQHGSQWVGPQGGVGAQTQAAVVTAIEGETTALAIRLDGQGTIAGVITDEATGEPAGNVEILAGNSGGTSEPDGSYELPGLGPYEWVVSFAGQWSGGGANRFAAIPVPVRENSTTPYNVKLQKKTTLTGRITGPAGQPPSFAELSVVNAKSFDIMGRPTVEADGTYSVGLLGPQDVKIHIIAAAGDRFVVMWYPNAAGFADGQAVSIPDSGSAVVDIPIR
ncbi:hypothetical protein Rhe02_30230 [Rhizocola hellebori]|uniref:Uncharacterized protein n=1 Tax=Rhizocola hellebori TaxID=1392758 RepID=A0A8J3Q845_9ACTN|nr:hypothetical protein Rhe02_30230 [Rhizocola hellebori]